MIYVRLTVKVDTGQLPTGTEPKAYVEDSMLGGDTYNAIEIVKAEEGVA